MSGVLLCMGYFTDEWFHDIPAVMSKTDDLYAQLVSMGKSNKIATTKRKIYEARGWRRDIAEENFDRVLDRLKVFYLPKALRPGPAFVFPLRDLDGKFREAQVRPLPDSYLFKPDHKYRRLGTNHAFKGPQWFGNDAETLQQIMKKKTVLLVEGPFDELACKLLAPECPVMSPLTKGLTEEHIEYLQILGVTHIAFMFDREADNVKRQGQRGEDAAEASIKKQVKSGISVGRVLCPARDPSDALRLLSAANELKFLLKDI